MGNKASHHNKHSKASQSGSEDGMSADETDQSTRRHMHTTALITLFEKLELRADANHAYPGELSKTTFENAFHGPLYKFGKLMYLQMLTRSVATNRERITREQFVKAGTEILQLYDDKQLIQYYFHLFASGKDKLIKDDAFQMFEISFSLTLSESKILHKEDERDAATFQAMATGLFGIKTELTLQEFSKWVEVSCPHLFRCVHNWVCNVMTGSTLPDELETAHVPQLEGVASSGNCTSMAILWVLSITLPGVFIRLKEARPNSLQGAEGATRDPMLTAMLLLRKIARLSQCQSWNLIYSSDSHGMSINRFNSHVSSYNAPTVTFISFEGKNLYCLAIDQAWQHATTKFGKEDCMLIQLAPVYRVVQAGAKMVRWCENVRGIPAGIQVGIDNKPEVLFIPKDFDKIHHYNVPCRLLTFEVWGCGADDALEAQSKQRKWEAKAVQKAQDRKLRPYGETWNDTPDKQLLQWGGVNVGNNSYNR